MFSPQEAAKRLHITPDYLRQVVRKNDIEISETPGGHRRYTEDDIKHIQSVLSGEKIENVVPQDSPVREPRAPYNLLLILMAIWIGLTSLLVFVGWDTIAASAVSQLKDGEAVEWSLSGPWYMWTLAGIWLVYGVLFGLICMGMQIDYFGTASIFGLITLTFLLGLPLLQASYYSHDNMRQRFTEAIHEKESFTIEHDSSNSKISAWAISGTGLREGDCEDGLKLSNFNTYYKVCRNSNSVLFEEEN